MGPIIFVHSIPIERMRCQSTSVNSCRQKLHNYSSVLVVDVVSLEDRLFPSALPYIGATVSPSMALGCVCADPPCPPSPFGVVPAAAMLHPSSMGLPKAKELPHVVVSYSCGGRSTGTHFLLIPPSPPWSAPSPVQDCHSTHPLPIDVDRSTAVLLQLLVASKDAA